MLKYVKKVKKLHINLQTSKIITAEDAEDSSSQISWLTYYWTEFRRRFLYLLGYEFGRKFRADMAMSILQIRNQLVIKQMKRKGNFLRAETLFSKIFSIFSVLLTIIYTVLIFVSKIDCVENIVEVLNIII